MYCMYLNACTQACLTLGGTTGSLLFLPYCTRCLQLYCHGTPIPMSESPVEPMMMANDDVNAMWFLLSALIVKVKKLNHSKWYSHWHQGNLAQSSYRFYRCKFSANRPGCVIH